MPAFFFESDGNARISSFTGRGIVPQLLLLADGAFTDICGVLVVFSTLYSKGEVTVAAVGDIGIVCKSVFSSIRCNGDAGAVDVDPLPLPLPPRPPLPRPLPLPLFNASLSAFIILGTKGSWPSYTQYSGRLARYSWRSLRYGALPPATRHCLILFHRDTRPSSPLSTSSTPSASGSL